MERTRGLWAARPGMRGERGGSEVVGEAEEDGEAVEVFHVLVLELEVDGEVGCEVVLSAEADVEEEAAAVVGELEVAAVEVEAGAEAYASVAEACEGVEAHFVGDGDEEVGVGAEGEDVDVVGLECVVEVGLEAYSVCESVLEFGSELEVGGCAVFEDGDNAEIDAEADFAAFLSVCGDGCDGDAECDDEFFHIFGFKSLSEYDYGKGSYYL